MSKTNQELNRHHRRNLPHREYENAVYFMTVCLKGALPKQKVEQLKHQRKEEIEHLKRRGFSKEEQQKRVRKTSEFYFGKFDALLDHHTSGVCWLKEDKIAQIWQDALFHFDNERYKIICSTIMSNHVHFIFYKLDRTLSSVMHSIKRYSGRKANQLIDKTGQPFWQDENFDRTIRHRIDLIDKIDYILKNPVKAGLVQEWSKWKWNYIRPEYKKLLK